MRAPSLALLVAGTVLAAGCGAPSIPRRSPPAAAAQADPRAGPCTSCHADVAKAHGGHPLAAAQCASCHVRHGEPGGAKLLREVAHEVVSDCSSCHPPPAAGAPAPSRPATLKPQPALCLDCHGELEAALARKVVHRAARDACTGCHSPHAADAPALLAAEPPALCGRCHAEVARLAAGKDAHAPVREGRCDRCHAPHAGDRAKLLIAAPDVLCTGCHREAAGWERRTSSHEPARSGDCLSCHVPHGGAPRLVAEKVPGALCAQCHEVQAEERKKAARAHPPVAGGACRTCHAPHAADRPALVARSADVLCVQCHRAKIERLSGAGAKLHNPFAGGDCTACHRAHGPQRALLRAEDASVCLECHRGVRKARAGGRSQHAPFLSGPCWACHEPHGTARENLLAKEPRALCLSCHDALARRLAAPKAVVHAAVSDGACSDCHAAHGGAAEALLRRDQPELCGECHDVAGDDLRKAHAGYSVGAARCTGCHDPHVSPGPKLVAASQHPPFADRDCATCHLAPDGRGEPRLKRDVLAECNNCHDLGKTRAQDVRCFDCHTPHASSRPHLLLGPARGACER